MTAQPDEPDDAALLRRAREGSEQAFADLVTRHRRRAWAVCLRITGNPDDAEDALQEALTAAWQHLDRFRGDARFSTWLHTIASNAALGVIRRRRDTPVDEVPERDHGRDVADRVADVDRVRTALLKLPEDFRQALVLREFGDLSYDEIARVQGVGVQTVKSRLNRARTALAAQLVVAGS